MRLDRSTWLEVEAYLRRSTGIIIPIGSTEQHGPMGLIGTDAICAEHIAERAAEAAGALVAPAFAYTPAPFNMAFPGTVSVSEEAFTALFRDVAQAFHAHGFRHLYVLNGHGANLAPLKAIADSLGDLAFRIRSWWDFEPVSALRLGLYGDWEGMHATPSEVSITQAIDRIVEPGAAEMPPQRLSRDFMRRHAGDRHGPADSHRRQFPDGRVGSHSALARPEHGRKLIEAATEAVARDFLQFCAPATR